MVNASEQGLTKPTVYETQRMQLTSPLMHIGSAVSQLSPFEHIQVGRIIYLPDQEALAQALYERGRLDDYIQVITDNTEIAPLLETTFGVEWQDMTDAEGHSIFPEHRRLTTWTERPIRTLRPMIRNGFGYPYIPGSSIKGAMRTAIAYHLLSHAKEYKVPSSNRVSEIEKTLRQRPQRGVPNWRAKQKHADDELFMNDLFTEFHFRYQNRDFKAESGPNTDLMRAVQVTDTQALKPSTDDRQDEATNVAIANKVIVSSHTSAGDAKSRRSPFVEMVHRVHTQFTLSLDTDMLSWFRHRQGMVLPFRSVDDLLKICRAFAQAQWEAEQAYWQQVSDRVEGGTSLDFSRIRQFYDLSQCPFDLRIGWASGMTGTTINGLFPEDLRAQIRDTCGIKAPGFPAPKTRRTVRNPEGDIEFTLGWVQFTAVD